MAKGGGDIYVPEMQPATEGEITVGDVDGTARMRIGVQGSRALATSHLGSCYHSIVGILVRIKKLELFERGTQQLRETDYRS